MTGYRVVGQRLPRLDADGKVTGRTVFGADVVLPGMLHGAIVRSILPHACITGIDTRRAATLPGVRAIITAADVLDIRYGGAVRDEPIFAWDRVRYVGQPVAAVAAVTPEAAAEARAAITVGYEPLPAVFDAEEAMAPRAPLVHEEWERYSALPAAPSLGEHL